MYCELWRFTYNSKCLQSTVEIRAHSQLPSTNKWNYSQRDRGKYDPHFNGGGGAKFSWRH